MKNNYKWLVLTGLVVWVVSTAYFGWNATPQSGQEGVLDTVSWVAIIWGVIGDVTSNLSITKKTIINTENIDLSAPHNDEK